MIIYRVIRESITDEETFEQRLKGVKEQTPWLLEKSLPSR